MEPLDPRLRSLLQELHAADDPPPEAEQRIWRSLAPHLREAAPPTAASARGASAVALRPGLVKLVLAALLIGAPALGVLHRRHRAAPRPDRTTHVQALVPRAAREPRGALPPTAADASAPASDLLEETRLLGEAQHALRARTPRSALRWAEEHAARFPEGMLIQQREAVRVLALCDLGRGAQAREARARFLRSWPGSPLAERVQHACPPP